MRITRRVVVGITVAALAVAGSGASATPGESVTWIRSYGTGEFGTNTGRRVVVSPDGGRVYVTGDSTEPSKVYSDFETIAYDAATGSTLWKRRYDGPGHSIDFPLDMALSADGAKLYIAGWVGNWGGDSDFGTIAYDAATGDQLWAQVFDGPVGSFDSATALAVDPVQPLVFVTGSTVVMGWARPTTSRSPTTHPPER
jgi:outer membrane protein assembly factor BamB